MTAANDSGLVISGERSITRGELMDRAAQAAAALTSLGIAEGDVVATSLRNDFAFFEVALGASLIGAYCVPLNWHFTADEAGYILEDCGAKLILGHADLLERIEAGIPEGVIVRVAATPPEITQAYGIHANAGSTGAEWIDWSTWIESFDAWEGEPRPPRSNLLYTSGTTGRPKGVRRMPATPEQQLGTAAMVKAAFGITPGAGIRTVITGPLYHGAPNMYGLAAVQSGGVVVLQPRFDAESLLAMIERYRITHVHLVPTMFVRLLNLPEETRGRYDLSSLEFVAHGAAPCPVEIKRRMIEWWGPIIHEYYGGTETIAVIHNDSDQALRKPGTIGLPIEGGAIKVYRDDGTEAAPGEPGEVYIRNYSIPDFTYHGLDQQRRDIARDGLVTCGDIGYLDEDGYLFLCDRARDMVISGGVNIYPAEVEAAIITIPGIRDVAVFGIPDEEYGEAVCAHVELAPGANVTAADIDSYLREHLAGFKVPRTIEFTEKLPREDSGKIVKRKLRETYWVGAGRKI